MLKFLSEELMSKYLKNLGCTYVYYHNGIHWIFIQYRKEKNVFYPLLEITGVHVTVSGLPSYFAYFFDQQRKFIAKIDTIFHLQCELLLNFVYKNNLYLYYRISSFFKVCVLRETQYVYMASPIILFLFRYYLITNWFSSIPRNLICMFCNFCYYII